MRKNIRKSCTCCRIWAYYLIILYRRSYNPRIMPICPLFYFIKQVDNKYVYIVCGIFGDAKRPSFLRPITDFHNLRRFYRFLTELQLHILLISFKITVYSYIVAGIKSGTRIGINPNKISRFIFTKKDGKNNEKEKRERK